MANAFSILKKQKKSTCNFYIKKANISFALFLVSLTGLDTKKDRHSKKKKKKICTVFIFITYLLC